MKLQIELKTIFGTKLEFNGLSKMPGVVYVKWKDVNTHVLIADLDEESQGKVSKLLEENKL